MESIRQVLIRRDGNTPAQAEKRIKEAEKALYLYLEEGDQDSAYNICAEHFGLEPDYLMDLL